MTRRKFSIVDLMEERALFGRWFGNETWQAWKVFLKALFAIAMTEAERAIFGKYTARTVTPVETLREAWLVVGRRGGKSLIAAFVAVYLACFRDYSRCLAPGERGTVMLIASDRRQARVIMRYIRGFLETSMLARMVVNQTQEAIDLNNRISIEIHTCSFRSTRGYTLVAVVADEIAFWRSEESASPDTEILSALRPGLATIPGSLLLCISSPYARRGALWQAYSKHYAKDGDPVLVWQADTRSMNPSVDQSIIDQAYQEDESAASAEWGAEFRRDIENYIAREAVQACIIPSRLELPFLSENRYSAFVDPSGGSQDSYCIAVAHRNWTTKTAILDCVRERKPPFSPEQVTEEFADLLKSYHIREVHGDRYAGEWPREQFRKHGISYRCSEKSKSDIYTELLPMLNSGRAELLDNPRLVAQLLGLERRTSRSGKDSIDHGPNAHDDIINAAAGAMVTCTQGLAPGDCGISFVLFGLLTAWALSAAPNLI